MDSLKSYYDALVLVSDQLDLLADMIESDDPPDQETITDFLRGASQGLGSLALAYSYLVAPPADDASKAILHNGQTGKRPS